MAGFKNEHEARESLNKTMVELNQLLKSMENGMNKAEDPQEGEGQEGADGAPQGDALATDPGAAGADGAAGAHGEPDGDEGQGAADGGGAGEGGDQAGAAPGTEAPGAEGGEGDMEGAMRQQAGELDDSELEMMTRILQEEQAKRHEAGAQAQGAAGPELAQSMKSELAGLAKSMKDEMTKMAKSFKDEISGLKADNAKLRSRPTTAPAATGKNVQVLDKKAPETKPLTKSFVMDHLMGKMRSKDRGGVKADNVALVNACRNDDDLAQAVQILKDEGIEIPAPK